MPASLDSLVKNLPEVKEIKKYFSERYHNLLARKGVFPYDYITDWEKLDEVNLPPKHKFYSRLNDENISDDDYEHACTVWKAFGCKTLGEYSDIYLKTDVLLLADVFEAFRNITLKTHKLDPCHYFTLPGLTWDAMLRFTGVKLELLHDYDQLLMIEKGIRGGICQVSHRYMEANNKYMDTYNPDEKTNYIVYQDCTNLYGDAMMRALPYAEFEWVDDPQILDIASVGEDDEYGYILDADLEYPVNLHEEHNDLPFLPESIKINAHEKLVAHFNHRENYIVHYTTLKLAINHGLKLVKINRALKFKQSRWLKPYIEHNTALRAKATNNFEKDSYKLYNNAAFGKTMENIRNRMNIELVCDSRKIEKLVARTNFIDRTIYGDNLVAVHMAKTTIKFDKPIYAGMSILDISKNVMYKYHYDTMRPRYGNEIQLAYIDTDSFIYNVHTEDVYNDMLEMIDHLDTSEYPIDHKCYSVKNKKVPGKFKDEVNGAIITAFAGLRAKMYALVVQNKTLKKAKGVQRSVLRKKIDFDDYVKCIKDRVTFRLPMNFIRSYKHNLTSIEMNKLSLSPFDDKRIVQEDGIHTKAIGFRNPNSTQQEQSFTVHRS